MRGLYKIGAACLVAVFAVAMMSGAAEASKADAQAEYNLKPWQLQDRWGITFAGADVNEAETNDTPGTANPYTIGDTFHGEIKAGDLDYVSFSCNAGDQLEIGTDADGGLGTVDTFLNLWDTDGTTLLDSDDDGGPGTYSFISYTIAASGTYYVNVEGFSGTSAGFYILVGIQAVPPTPPANDDCATAVKVPCGVNNYSGSTELAVDDYTPSLNVSDTLSCTGFYALGGDVVYELNLTGTETVDISYTNAADASLYIITDCNDPIGSCVAGADNTFTGQAEVINGFSGTGTFYIILDTFSGFTPGGTYTADITVNCPTATEETSWSDVKDLFR